MLEKRPATERVRTPRQEDSPSQSRGALWIAAVLLVIAFAGGGGSRNDVLSLLYVQPVAAVALVILLLAVPLRPGEIRFPLILLSVLAAWMAIQLVPLPPSVWALLPGHDLFLNGAALADGPQPWRPISVSPDLTLASLVGLVTPLAVLLACSALTERQMRVLVAVVAALVVVSIVLAIAQIAGGASSPVYLYAVTNDDSGVGLFANRNHQALFLACGFPLFVTWAFWARPREAANQFRSLVCGLGLIILVPMLLFTGSRAGIILGALGMVFAGAIYWIIRPFRVSRKTVGISASVLAVLGILVVVFTYLAGSRALTLTRTNALDVADDARFGDIGTMVRLALDFFPFGSGFGTFAPVYQIVEPDIALSAKYFNQAHNDALDIVLAGGLPGLLVALAFVVWLARHAAGMTRSMLDRRPFPPLALLGIAIITLCLLSSLVDYPLRTPAIGSLFALACAWLCRYGDATRLSPRAARPDETSERRATETRLARRPSATEFESS